MKPFGISERTLYRVGKNVRNNKPLSNYANCGRRPLKMDARKIASFKRIAEGWDKSKGLLAEKFGISKPYCIHLLKKFGIDTWSKVDAPKSTPAQQQRQIDRLQSLSSDLMKVNGHRDIIMDDESYFPLSGKTSKHFLSSDRKSVPDNTKFKVRSKFEKRLLVWIAISKKGHSEPFFVPKNCAVTAEIYRTNCITERLKPFIEKYYPNGRYMFWPDGASAHYASSTLETFENLAIKVVEKEQNPPNVPQLRPIERFWSHLKQKVYKDGWEAKTFRQLKLRIKKMLKEFELEYFENLMKNCKEKIAHASANGPLSVIN